MTEVLRDLFDRWCEFKIPLITAGILIAILSIFSLMWQSPWGISAGYRNWGEWVLYGLSLSDSKPEVPWFHGISLSNIGMFMGAMASALLAKRFALQPAPASEYVKASIGGCLMGCGAALAGGCNVGGFFSAVGLFSMGGYAMMVGLCIGAFLGIKILLLTIHVSSTDQGTPPVHSSFFTPKPVAQQILGVCVVLGLVLAFYIYSGAHKTLEGGLLFFGSLIGFIMHRSRFCFARAFRCPFMTGDSEMVNVVALSLLIYGLGAAVIKWSYIQPPGMGAHHPFWIGSFAGGVLFGTGMVIAGGCASSTLWRLGEGNMKLLFTLFFFAVSNALVHPLVSRPMISALLGSGTFLPELISWGWAIPVFIVLLLFWVALMAWNERTDKFVIF